MSVLNRDDFFNRINTIVGTDTSDDALAFIEDMTDTYNSLETTANGDGANWEQRYHELDECWKAKYKRRFFTGNGSTIPVVENSEQDEVVTPESITIDDLFTEK